MRINSNHSNLAFDREIDNARAWLQARIFDACGYPSGVLCDRLMQRLVQISRYPYALAVSVLCKAGGNCFPVPVPGAQIDCGRASMEMGSGKITVTARQLLANQRDFFLRWAYCLSAIVFVKKAGKNDHRPAVLVSGIGEESLFIDKDDLRFVNYCRSGPIVPLRDGKRFLVQSASRHASSCPSDFNYCRSPLIELLREAQLGFSGRLRLAVSHLILFFAYVSAVFRLRQLSLLGGDFAYCSIATELDRRGLIESIVVTISSIASQPLWARNLQRANVHMAWYAQNFKPIVHSADGLESDIPTLRWMRVDTHWVWTHALARYLRSLGQDKAIEVVGPILWYLPEMSTPAKSAIEILVLDNSPFDDETALRNGEIVNYNHPDNLFSFVRDVTALKPELEKTFRLRVSFRWKTARGYRPGYDKAYFDHLEALNSRGSISLEHYSANMYSLISSSHLVIVYPFSSPAYVADFLHVPSIYYDPTNSVSRHDFGDAPSLISFANTPDKLLSAAISALTGVFAVEAVLQ